MFIYNIYNALSSNINEKVMPANMYSTIERCNYLLERKTNRNFKVKLEAAAKDLVETHYYIRKYNLKSLDENPFYKILGHIYCAYWSCIIQQCNFYELMRRVGHDEYDNFIITPEDIRRTVLWYTDKFKNCKYSLIYKQHIKTVLYNDEQIKKDWLEANSCENYKKIPYIQNKLKYDFIKYTNIEDYDDKTYMPIYYYHSGTKNKRYYSIKTYDGASVLYFDEVYKEQLARYYLADHKGCNKFILDLLKPYFPMDGFTVSGEKVKLKKLCDNIRQYVHNHKQLKPLTEAEIDYFRCDMRTYIENCGKLWGNQDYAKQWIAENLDENGNDKFSCELDGRGVVSTDEVDNKKGITTTVITTSDGVLTSCDKDVEDRRNKILKIEDNKISYKTDTSLSQDSSLPPSYKPFGSNYPYGTDNYWYELSRYQEEVNMLYEISNNAVKDGLDISKQETWVEIKHNIIELHKQHKDDKDISDEVAWKRDLYYRAVQLINEIPPKVDVNDPDFYEKLKSGQL